MDSAVETLTIAPVVLLTVTAAAASLGSRSITLVGLLSFLGLLKSVHYVLLNEVCWTDRCFEISRSYRANRFRFFVDFAPVVLLIEAAAAVSISSRSITLVRPDLVHCLLSNQVCWTDSCFEISTSTLRVISVWSS